MISLLLLTHTFTHKTEGRRGVVQRTPEVFQSKRSILLNPPLIRMELTHLQEPQKRQQVKEKKKQKQKAVSTPFEDPLFVRERVVNLFDDPLYVPIAFAGENGLVPPNGDSALTCYDNVMTKDHAAAFKKVLTPTP